MKNKKTVLIKNERELEVMRENAKIHKEVFEEKKLQQEFLIELNKLTDYDFKEYDSVLNAMSVQNYFVPLGDQIPLTTFLRVYSNLLEKAKLLKESLWGDLSWPY